MPMVRAVRRHYRIVILFGFVLTVCRAPAVAQETSWVSRAHIALQRLVDQRSALPATLYPPIDTELPGHGTGQVILLISRSVPSNSTPTVPGGSGAICHYEPVRQGNRIPATCNRLLTPEGGDFRVRATVYGLDERLGIPADHVKPNGALLAEGAKPLLLYIDEIIAIGILGSP